MIYFTADLHLGHKNILKLSNRPFTKIDAMDEVLINNWNKKVKGNDTVYIMGDLIYKSQEPEKYLKELKGKKVLIMGNHDGGWLSKIAAEKYFIKTTMLLEQSLCNHMITLCHYPMLEWRGSRKDFNCKRLGYLIHGHIHDRVEDKYLELFKSPHALNAGVDINNFEPVTFDELVANNIKHKKSLL